MNYVLTLLFSFTGVFIRLYKYVTLRGNGQGVDKCHLYCTKHFTSESLSGRSRYDWVQVRQGQDKVFVQLSALVQLLDVSNSRDIKSKLLYFGLSTIKSNVLQASGTRLQLAPVFPTIKYEVTYDYRHFTILDTVDSIILPACVFPISMERGDYTISTPRIRATIRFMYIPFEFWFRDDWGKAVVNVNAEILRNVHNSQSVRNYLSANREGRQRKYMELMQTLEANGLETQAITDAEIVQRHLEWR